MKHIEWVGGWLSDWVSKGVSEIVSESVCKSVSLSVMWVSVSNSEYEWTSVSVNYNAVSNLTYAFPKEATLPRIEETSLSSSYDTTGQRDHSFLAITTPIEKVSEEGEN